MGASPDLLMKDVMAPQPLTPGDTVGFVAPGKQLASDIVLAARQEVESWGLRVMLGAHTVGRPDSYLAANDENRRSDLQHFLDDETVRAIVCVRGGYGTTRILDLLDFSRFIRRPKWVIGFSDITALHLALFKNGVASIHGPMPVTFQAGAHDGSLASLREIMMGSSKPIALQPFPLNRHGIGKGPLIGGNLSLLVDSLGTSTSPETKDAVMVIEETDESIYKIDRMLTQLSRAGGFEDLSALLVGHFSRIHDSDPPFGTAVENLIWEKVRDYQFPVAFNFPSGHESPNFAWIHGALATIDVHADGSQLQYVQDGGP